MVVETPPVMGGSVRDDLLALMRQVKKEDIMRIAEKNIEFIKERTKDGIPYGYHLHLKDGTAYDFANYDDRNRTTAEEFKSEWLPKSMQKFMAKHPCVMWGEPDEWQGSVFVHYIYR